MLDVHWMDGSVQGILLVAVSSWSRGEDQPDVKVRVSSLPRNADTRVFAERERKEAEEKREEERLVSELVVQYTPLHSLVSLTTVHLLISANLLFSLTSSPHSLSRSSTFNFHS